MKQLYLTLFSSPLTSDIRIAMNTRIKDSLKSLFSIFNFLILSTFFSNCADTSPKVGNPIHEMTEEEQRGEIHYEVLKTLEDASTDPEETEKIIADLTAKGIRDLRYVNALIRGFQSFTMPDEEYRPRISIIIETISRIAAVHRDETIEIVYNEMVDVGTHEPNGFNSRIIHGGCFVLQRLGAQLSEEKSQKLRQTIPILTSRIGGESSAIEVVRFLAQSGNVGQKTLVPLMDPNSKNTADMVLEISETEPIENPELLSSIVMYVSHYSYSRSAKAVIAFQGARMLDPIYAAMDHATPSGSRHSRTPNWQGSEPVIYATVDLGISLLLIESPVLPLLVHVAKYSSSPIKAEVFSSAILFDENKYESILLGINHEDPRVASMALMILSLEMNNDEIKPDQKLLEAATNYYNKTKNTDERNLIVLNDFWGPDAERLNGSTAASFDIPDIAKKLVKDFWDIDLSP